MTEPNKNILQNILEMPRKQSTAVVAKDIQTVSTKTVFNSNQSRNLPHISFNPKTLRIITHTPDKTMDGKAMVKTTPKTELKPSSNIVLIKTLDGSKPKEIILPSGKIIPIVQTENSSKSTTPVSVDKSKDVKLPKLIPINPTQTPANAPKMPVNSTSAKSPTKTTSPKTKEAQFKNRFVFESKKILIGTKLPQRRRTKTPDSVYKKWRLSAFAKATKESTTSNPTASTSSGSSSSNSSSSTGSTSSSSPNNKQILIPDASTSTKSTVPKQKIMVLSSAECNRLNISKSPVIIRSAVASTSKQSPLPPQLISTTDSPSIPAVIPTDDAPNTSDHEIPPVKTPPHVNEFSPVTDLLSEIKLKLPQHQVNRIMLKSENINKHSRKYDEFINTLKLKFIPKIGHACTLLIIETISSIRNSRMRMQVFKDLTEAVINYENLQVRKPARYVYPSPRAKHGPGLNADRVSANEPTIKKFFTAAGVECEKTFTNIHTQTEKWVPEVKLPPTLVKIPMVSEPGTSSSHPLLPVVTGNIGLEYFLPDKTQVPGSIPHTIQTVAASNLQMVTPRQPEKSPPSVGDMPDILRLQLYKDWNFCTSPDLYGNMPLHNAVLQNDYKAVQRQCLIMMKKMSNVNIKNESQDMTALHLAVVHKASPDIMKLLLRHGANPEIQDTNGDTCLHLAVRHGDSDTMKLLIFHRGINLDLNIFNYEGSTPLMLCAEYNKVDIAKMLLKHEAKPNLRDPKSGRTVLFHAVENNNFKMVQLLLEYDANPRIRTFCGVTAYEAANELDIDSSIRQEISRVVSCNQQSLNTIRKRHRDPGSPKNATKRNKSSTYKLQIAV